MMPWGVKPEDMFTLILDSHIHDGKIIDTLCEAISNFNGWEAWYCTAGYIGPTVWKIRVYRRRFNEEF